MNFKLLKLARTAARVQRLHTLPSHHCQSVGEHTFGVLWLAHLVCAPRLPSANLLTAIMKHDISEAVTGDVPGNVIRNCSELGAALAMLEARVEEEFGLPECALTEWEKDVAHFCDKAEFIIFALEEVADGNAKLMPRVRNGLQSMKLRFETWPTPSAERLMIRLEALASRYPGDHGEHTMHGWPGDAIKEEK